MDEIPTLTISPPPIYDTMLMENGSLTQAWQDWFSQLQITLNQIIESLPPQVNHETYIL